MGHREDARADFDRAVRESDQVLSILLASVANSDRRSPAQPARATNDRRGPDDPLRHSA